MNTSSGRPVVEKLLESAIMYEKEIVNHYIATILEEYADFNSYKDRIWQVSSSIIKYKDNNKCLCIGYTPLTPSLISKLGT